MCTSLAVAAVMSTLLFAVPSGAATYYVSPSGNDLYPGSSQSAPWKTIARVNAYQFGSGDKVLFARGGTWREQLVLSSNDMAFGSYGSGSRPIISGADLYRNGWIAAGTNVWRISIGFYPPEQVWFNNVLGQGVTSQAAILTINQWYYQNGYLSVYSSSDPSSTYAAPGIEVAQRDSALLINNVRNTTVSDIAFVNGNYNAIDIGPMASGTQAFDNVLWQGAQYEGLRAAGGAQKIVNSEGLYSSIGISIGGGAGVQISNSILSGNRDGAIEIYGTTGASTITSSTVSGNAAPDPFVASMRNYSDYPLTVSHSILLPNPVYSAVETYIGITDDGTNANTSPAFVARAAPLAIVPYIDDYNNLDVAKAVSTVAHRYGCHLSYAVNTKLVDATGWTALSRMRQAGDEIVAHSRSHSDLANNNVFTVAYHGPASTAMLSINVPSGRLQTRLNGASQPDLNIDISDPYDTMSDVCTKINRNTAYSCDLQANQMYFTPSVLAAVSSANIKQPYLASAGSNYLAFEIEGAKADIETNMPGYRVKSFATPFTSSNSTVEGHIRDAGFLANRNGTFDANLQLNGTWLLSGLDIYNMGAVWLPSEFDVAQPTSSTAALVEGMGASGGVIGVYSHGYDEFTLASWELLFQNLQNFGAICMTMAQAAEYIEQNGSLVPDGERKNWVRSVALASNFATTVKSPPQGAKGLQ